MLAVQNKVWDMLHGKTVPTQIGDVDVVYFDQVAVDDEFERRYEERLHSLKPVTLEVLKIKRSLQ
ncbi:nucleotidyltransferase family protein [Bacillus testis]|uniref:nucleotidyltransferase family protein n=1 Tax=Bacillus testis TaxID=1622072 RepID=UPI00067EFB5C|nr:nucleotidyltransferase family protein [Bacillus testis]